MLLLQLVLLKLNLRLKLRHCGRGSGHDGLGWVNDGSLCLR